jgi:IclR family acetate operon transcriptional repressor
MSGDTRDTGAYTGRTIERALDVLECLREAEGPLALNEVCRRSGLGPSTAHRLLAVLERRRYIYRDAHTRRYALGFQAFHLGQTREAMQATARRALPALRQLASEFGAAAHFCAREGTRVVLLESARPPTGAGLDDNRPAPPVLERYVDAHASAIGKVLLAYLPDDDIRKLYRDVPLTRHTRATLTTIDRLLAALAAVRREGYATDRNELAESSFGAAVPLVNLLGAINLGMWLVWPGITPNGHDIAPAVARAAELTRRIAAYHPVD